MSLSRIFTLLMTLLAAPSLAFLVPPASAQDWSSKPIRIVVPFPPGGALGTLARQIQPSLAARLGQPIIIDQRPGAGGSIGTASVAKSPPDGYTFVLVSDTHVLNALALKNIQFDAQKDFAPVSLITTVPVALIGHPKLAADTLNEVVALAKRSPGSVSYASPGPGSLAHLGILSLERSAGIELNHVPYRGGGQVMTDLIGSQVHLFLTYAFFAKPFVDAGQVKPIAVFSRTRSPAMPNVPTTFESNHPTEIRSWFAMLAPAGTPRPIIERMRSELVNTLQDPSIKQRLTDQALNIVGSSPEELEKFIATEMEFWVKVFNDNNISAN